VERWIRILAVVLGLQVLLVGFAWLGGRGPQETGGDVRFLDRPPQEIVAVTIQGAEDGPALTLERRGEGWVIARLDDLPAAGERIDELLRRLHEARVGPAVGTTASALERFRVADDAFERRLTLRDREGGEWVLYVGDSAGPGRVYARLGGRETAHELAIRRYEFGDAVRDWAAKDLLHVNGAEITRISIDEDLTLVRGEAGWTLAGEDAKVDQEEAQRLVDRLTRISFNEVVSEAESRKGEPLLTVRIERKDGDPVVYRFYAREGEAQDASEYLLQIEGRPWWFVVPGYAAAGVIDLDRDKLLGEQSEAEKASEETADSASGD
jgi:hypothetical protein